MVEDDISLTFLLYIWEKLCQDIKICPPREQCHSYMQAESANNEDMDLLKIPSTKLCILLEAHIIYIMQ